MAELLRLLQPPPTQQEEGQGEERRTSEVAPPQPPPPSALALVNRPLDWSGFTLLHVAAAAGQKAAVQLLMDAGADPACRYPWNPG